MCIINCPLKMYIYTQIIHSSRRNAQASQILISYNGPAVPAHNEKCACIIMFCNNGVFPYRLNSKANYQIVMLHMFYLSLTPV